jgi:hypothetical protein
MSQARLIDGLTGELIGGQPALYGVTGTTTNQYATTTTHTHPSHVHQTTYVTDSHHVGSHVGSHVYQTGSNVYQTGYTTAVNQVSHVHGPQVVNTVVNTGK